MMVVMPARSAPEKGAGGAAAPTDSSTCTSPTKGSRECGKKLVPERDTVEKKGQRASMDRKDPDRADRLIEAVFRRT